MPSEFERIVTWSFDSCASTKLHFYDAMRDIQSAEFVIFGSIYLRECDHDGMMIIV